MICIIIVIVIIALASVYFYYYKISNGPIGGETDSHGCLGPAGYSWNSSLGFCLREWELNNDQRKAAEIAIGPLSYPVTIINVDA